LQIKDERGYLILAVNTDVDYVKCARQLANSLRAWHSAVKICLLTDQIPDSNIDMFDYVIKLPYGDLSLYRDCRLDNDWQAGYASPFRQTIKLEADMLVTSPIDHWWDLLQHRDVVVSTGARDFYSNTATSRFYRKVFDNNNLPDVYNAITYWRYSQAATEFWLWVRRIFENWDKYKNLLKFPDPIPTTDVVYAMVAQIMGPENTTMPFASYPKIVHMKRHMIPIQLNNWTRELVWEMDDNRLMINTVAQNGLFHYHIKDWNPNE
jgi:hypothetical protein